MDNERPIEKLLRAFAKKRRDDAGAPPGLHPATRRMLQGEVSRQFPKPAGDRRDETASAARAGGSIVWKFLARLHPRLVYVLCAFVVIAVGVVLLLPSSNRPTFGARPSPTAKDNKMDLAKNMPGPVASPTQSRESRKPGLPAKPATPPAGGPGDATVSYSGRSQVMADGAKVELPTAGLAFKRTAGGATGIDLAGAANPRQSFAADEASKARLELAVAEPALREKEIPPRTDNIGADAGNGPAVQRFVRPDFNTLRGRAAKTDVTASPASVLASFQVEQAGNQVRVVDDDGSTYTGAVESAETAFSAPALDQVNNRVQGQPGRSGGGGVGSRTSAQHIVLAPVTQPQSAQPIYNFRVSGTNRTLQQPVVFMWNYVPAKDDEAALSQAGAANGAFEKNNAAPGQGAPLLRQNISGQMRLGNGKETPVEAVPAAP